jgi:chemosensory pili system protein ChpA (sensor histidine kinase/response regulator)
MGSRRVLIVDDDSSVQRVLVRVFERAGFSVTVACNGRQALSKLMGAERFDAMVSDIQMPKMTGRELVSTLASEGPYLPGCVFIVTSRSESEERNWIHQFPGVSLLEKPVSPKEILRLVQQRLSNLPGEGGSGDARRAA